MSAIIEFFFALQETPDGSIIKERWDLLITLQKNSAHDLASAMVSPNYDEQACIKIAQ